ncbi:PPP family 3-phenylpropionic acid transporter [Caulobacter ginsengisoli]|uniref:PPP family 3-phenylpropionic acid transporter n=1 Tax=Caulobacter ginsengisoli TaxID=400775 RepID=A0ABU0IJZ3_9CAUL|nr:MFS transporter [Caulobacter ginsengisoli]MDQ0462326.1 PPP family 3-phenylpropionic acid transporter [Caulobacter ginsengisoli]
MPTSLRMGLYYAGIFIGTGASLPYMSVWFHDHGLNGAQIGMILSAPMLGRLFSGPALAVSADGFKLRRTPLMLLGFGSGLAFGAIALFQGFPVWLLCWLAGACLQGGMSPLGDVMTLRLAAREGFAYGPARSVGSMAFVVGNLLGGVVLASFGSGAILAWTVAAALLSGVFARLLLPPEPVHEGGAAPASRSDRWAGLGQLLRDRTFMLIIVSAGLIQATHAFYYVFSSLLWQGQGISDFVIGALWATGVIAEIGFMLMAERIRRRVGPERLILIGGVAALLRWCASPLVLPPLLLFPLQALHALSFTATFIGSLQLIQLRAPARFASAAQSLATTLSSGLLIGLATLASGPLFDRFGSLGYLAMAVMALAGVIGAARLPRALSRA